MHEDRQQPQVWTVRAERGWDDVRPHEVADLASRYAHKGHKGLLHWRANSAGGGEIESGDSIFHGPWGRVIDVYSRTTEVIQPLNAIGRFLAAMALPDAVQVAITFISFTAETDSAPRPAALCRAARDVADGLAGFLDSVLGSLSVKFRPGARCSTCSWATLTAQRELTGIPDAPREPDDRAF